MTRKELINRLASAAQGESKATIDRIVRKTMSLIDQELKNTGKVSLPGVGVTLIAKPDMAEKITWVLVETQLPDDNITVLLNIQLGDEPVWIGYHEDNCWCLVDGFALPNDSVIAWAHLPAGPNTAQ